MHRLKFSALAAAAVLCVGLHSGEASALALGKITVQSALGEPLRAEIDVPQITPAEAESLRATTASPEVFRSQGMEFNPLMNALQIQLQRRADGSAVLRVTSDRPVNDPFLDLVLDTTWGSGKIVRSYTLLLDPPALRSQAPTATAAPQITAPARAQRPAVAASTTAPAGRAPAAARPAPTDGVTVKAGDTAGRIANAHRPADVSLDQMLVAMMRANPDAFIRGNVNRVRAGSVLQIPDEATAKSVSNAEARQILAAQSRDFNTFRRKLADSAPKATVASAERSASGKVQAQVEDRKPATAAPDKLTLSKGSLKGQKAAEDQLAKDKQASEANARMAELSKNISDLNKVSAASAAGAAPAPTQGASTPAAVTLEAPGALVTPTAPQAPASTPEVPAEAASTPVNAASATDTAASAPTPEATAPAASKPKVALPPPPPVEEPSFLDGLMEDPMIPMAGGGLLALLVGYGVYRVMQRRRRSGGVDSSFMESRVQPDSFFGASGGQRIDTANSDLGSGGSSSMAYSPSQLDAGGDVDPVAEADVYLAYGRDLQAEEILKEAARHNPARVSVHVKLGEIYAKRQDRKALEAVAGEVFKLTQGEGPDWARIAELGLSLDPENALYQPGGHPGGEVAPSAPPTNFATTVPASIGASVAAALPSDLDLDLDLDLPDDALTDAPAVGGFAAAAAASGLAPEMELPSLSEPAPASAPTAEAAPTLDPLSDTDDQSISPTSPAPLSASAPDSNSLEFDLGDISLDLTVPATLNAPLPDASPPSEEIATVAAPMGEDDDGEIPAQDDPLATKLALAEEFNAIGDTDGARTLIEEVVAEATGALKTRAQRLLADLG